MTVTELVPYQAAPAESLELMPKAWDLAQRIARTEFVPTALRGKPEAVLACILTGQELGIGAMQALSKVHVIEGRPALSAELMRALVLRAGHDLWIEESTTTKCTVAGCRRGSSRETRVVWTMDDAKRAGLDGRPNYRKYPKEMLLARASAGLVRAVFPEVLAGLSYSIEEVRDGDFEDAAFDDTGDTDTTPPKATKTRKASKAITAKSQPAEAPAEPPTAREEPPLPGEGSYEGQDQELEGPKMAFENAAAMRAKDAGIESDDDRHGLWLAITSNRTSSAKDLSDAERSTAMELLGLLKEQKAALCVQARGTDDEAWVVVDENLRVAHASRLVDLGVELLAVAPPFFAGKSIKAGAAVVQDPAGSDADQASADESGSAGTPGPDASSRPSTPSQGPEMTAPATEAEWRALMRERQLKMSDLARIVAELHPDDSGVSVPKLVENPELGAEVFARIIGSPA